MTTKQHLSSKMAGFSFKKPKKKNVSQVKGTVLVTIDVPGSPLHVLLIQLSLTLFVNNL